MVIAVEDSGIGIAPDRLNQVFERFTQADPTTSRLYGGTGLGLPISAQLAQLMGGTIEASSVVGQGSRFELRLPLVAAEPGCHAELAMPSVHLSENARSLRILIAEDNTINQRLSLGMVGMLGHSAEVAADGAEAVARVIAAREAGAPYDLVLMDLQMPKLDGHGATRALRTKGLDAETLPIIALTANAYPEDIAGCRAAGMQDHLAKPLRLRDLAAKLEKWAPRPELVTDDWEQETDPELIRLYRERKRVAMAAIEAALRSGNFTGVTLKELAAQLHQIAGVAAFFGEAAVGEMSGAMEERLVAASEAEAPALLTQTLAQLAA